MSKERKGVLDVINSILHQEILLPTKKKKELETIFSNSNLEEMFSMKCIWDQKNHMFRIINLRKSEVVISFTVSEINEIFNYYKL